ncbi:MAG TPA: NAD-dependent epimerase/dehydratase family protein, partial [Humisphaera sp.]
MPYRLHMPKRLVIAGGNGYLGRHVARWFADRNWDVVLLSRRAGTPTPSIRTVVWDGKSHGPWAGEVDGADALLNLAGRTVNCRYNAKNKAEIYASRLDSTRVLGQAVAGAKNPPPAWLNAASATIYRHAEDRPMDEATGEFGTDFSVDVCKRWEAELMAADVPRTRRVALRA